MMAIPLNELVITAKKGCITHPDDVEDIVNHFVNNTLENLDSATSIDCKGCFEVLLPSVSLSNRRLGELNYLDLICLIDNLSGNDYFIGERKEFSFYFRLFQIDLLKTMLIAAKDCHKIQMFLSLSVKSFYDYLERRRNDHMAAARYSELVHKTRQYSRYEISATTSIAEFLKHIASAKDVVWKPWKETLSEYEEHLLQGNEILRDFLVASFRVGYAERCKLTNIIEKYSDNADFTP